MEKRLRAKLEDEVRHYRESAASRKRTGDEDGNPGSGSSPGASPDYEDIMRKFNEQEEKVSF